MTRSRATWRDCGKILDDGATFSRPMKKRGNGPLRFWHLSGGLQSNITRLSKANANPSVQDRTDIHHAVRRNDTLALRALVHDQMKAVNEKNENDDSPIMLELRQVCWSFTASMIQRSSIRLGSFAAIKAASDINVKDGDYGGTSLH